MCRASARGCSQDAESCCVRARNRQIFDALAERLKGKLTGEVRTQDTPNCLFLLHLLMCLSSDSILSCTGQLLRRIHTQQNAHGGSPVMEGHFVRVHGLQLAFS